MDKTRIKIQLHNYIDMIEDESQLEMLNEAAETYAIKKKTDILDLLTGEQLERLEQAIQQVDEGKIISHEEVIKISRQWLIK
ncbi:MAG: hypothetical protein ABIR03_14645 [Ginsengibacter sp.]